MKTTIEITAENAWTLLDSALPDSAIEDLLDAECCVSGCGYDTQPTPLYWDWLLSVAEFVLGGDA